MTETTIQADVGVDFEITVKEDGAIVDISTATATAIEFRKPSGARVEKTGVFVTDGTDGKMKYRTLASGEFDELGLWDYRGKVTFGASLVYYTNPPKQFNVIN